MSNMNSMQFRDFIFRTNPEKISVSDSRNIVTHFCPGKPEVVQDLGSRARIVTCSGSFWGANFSEAISQLVSFRRKSGGEGILYLPGMDPFRAVLTELAFDATGDGRVIPYTMRFLEVMENEAADQTFFGGH